MISRRIRVRPASPLRPGARTSHPSLWTSLAGARDPSVARSASSADRPWIGVPSALLSIGHGAHQTFIGTSNRLRIGTSILIPPRTTSTTSVPSKRGGDQCNQLLNTVFGSRHLFDCGTFSSHG